LVKQFRKVKAHIKSLLLFHGIVIPTEFDNPNWSKNFQQWLFQLPWPNITGMQCMHSKLRVYNLLNKEILQTSNELRAYCRKIHHKDYYLLKSIPGIGGILSTAIFAELGDSIMNGNSPIVSDWFPAFTKAVKPVITWVSLQGVKPYSALI
jgi:transposase